MGQRFGTYRKHCRGMTSDCSICQVTNFLYMECEILIVSFRNSWLYTIRLNFQVPEQFGAPRVVTSGRGSQLVVGTTRNCVLEGSFTFPIRPVMQVSKCFSVLCKSSILILLLYHVSQQLFPVCLLSTCMQYSTLLCQNFILDIYFSTQKYT